jgi:hypothetical protein
MTEEDIIIIKMEEKPAKRTAFASEVALREEAASDREAVVQLVPRRRRA